MTARTILLAALVFTLAGGSQMGVRADEAGGETLYNGIRSAQPWPPRPADFAADPVTPPCLLSPPERIPIDVGRQLFVDDFLIEKTTLKRTYHLPEYYSFWISPDANGASHGYVAGGGPGFTGPTDTAGRAARETR